MTAVDLRSQYEQVYNQGSDNNCGPHATTAVLDVVYERATGKPHRFDKQHIWQWCLFYQGLQGNRGITFDGLSKALKLQGVKLDGQIIRGFELARTKFDRDWDEVKILLKAGVPQILNIRAGRPGFDDRNNGKPWRQHRWGTLPELLTDEFTHATALVGFDDAAQCWLVENSWGAQWGDGGFFGIPYDQANYMLDSMWNINVMPIRNVPIEGFRMPAYMLTHEKAAFVDRSKDALMAHLMASFGSGVQSLIDECIRWGVSDKHLETIAGWERGSVRAFKAENPALAWDGFIWDQL